jgi:hypothetical protein
MGEERVSKRDALVSVREIFEGLPPGTKSAIVSTEGWLLEKGQQYLFDTSKGEDGHFYPSICGNTGEVTYKETAEFLDYLRLRAKGKAMTSLTVSATDHDQPVPDADVAITGSKGQLMKHTGPDGRATFSEIPAARYEVVVQKEHYHLDAESSNDAVDVLAGTCPGTRVSLQAESAVNGLVRDAKGSPVASLQLELVTVPDHPMDKISLSRPFFLAKTDSNGQFFVDAVSPGKYLLGSNIIGLSTSRVPPTFYPGRETRAAAVPIEVELGKTTGNLILNLPDFGAQRQFEFCVVDAAGKPQAGAKIDVDTKEGTSGFGDDLATDDSGCVRTFGYARATYAVRAVFNRPGASWRETRDSDTVVMPPGEGPVREVLKLGMPIGTLLLKNE